MIVLDTNVISELMRPAPHPAVLAWVATQPRATLFTTGINQAEILYGIAALLEGKRQNALAMNAEAMFAEDFAGHVLPFTNEAAAHYARVVMARRRKGNAIETFDALIAAAAIAAGAAVATHDTRGFDGCGLTLIDPWGGP